MARGKGTANLAASIEPLAGAPLDARDIVPTVADLYVAANWPYKYIGMKTTVTATGDTYRLVNMDVTQESSWVLDGGSGGQTIQVETMPTASAEELGKVYQYIGATGGGAIHGYFYECVALQGGGYGWLETEVSAPTEELSSSDMEDVKGAFNPVIESVGGLPILFDEGGTERQVGWYRYANGTKKPVYEKCVTGTISAPTDNVNNSTTLEENFATTKKLLSYQGYIIGSNFQRCVPDVLNSGSDTTVTYYTRVFVTSDNSLKFGTNMSSYNGSNVTITIRYTKTTDTPA